MLSHVEQEEEIFLLLLFEVAQLLVHWPLSKADGLSLELISVKPPCIYIM